MKESAHRRLFVLAIVSSIAIGLFIRKDALWMGFYGDDSVQIAMLRGEFPAPRSSLDLFRFADATRDGGRLLDFGFVPWWAQKDLKLALFRPLTSALMTLDYRLFGPNAVAFHVHSLLWFGALLGVAALLFREILPRTPAALATLLFALAPCQCAPVTWLANRSTLVATTFGVLGLWVHVRFRYKGTLRHRAVEGIAFLLAFAGGEYAWSVVAFVAAFELVRMDVRPMKERLGALVPAFSAAALCLLVRAAFGFGAHGSGFYIDPLDSPAAFASALAERTPALAADLFFLVPARWWAGGNPWTADLAGFRQTQTILGVLALVLLAWAARFVTAEQQGERRSLLWLYAGTVASLVPAAGALPEDRLLLAAALGSSAILATLVTTCVASARDLVQRRSALALVPVGLVGATLFFHVGRAARRSYRQVAWYVSGARAVETWALDADIAAPVPADARVMILSAADFTTNALLPWVRRLRGDPLPHSYVRLSGAPAPHKLVRIADRVLEVTVLADALDATIVGSLYRSRGAPFRAGDTVDRDGMHVEVLDTQASNPSRMRFTFDRSLDDRSYVLLQATQQGLRPMTVPAVGETLYVAAPTSPLP